jgi:hypothetical protein
MTRDKRMLLRRWLLIAACASGLTIVLVVLLVSGLVLGFGSWEVAMAYARGESTFVMADPAQLADVRPDEEISTTIRLRNVSTVPVRILGGNASCGCMVLQDLPLDLKPGEYRTIQIRVRPPKKEGARFRYDVVLYESAPGPPVLTYVSGTVAGAAKSGSDSDN